MESVRQNINEDVKLFLATLADPQLSERTWKVLKKRTSEKLKKKCNENDARSVEYCHLRKHQRASRSYCVELNTKFRKTVSRRDLNFDQLFTLLSFLEFNIFDAHEF